MFMTDRQVAERYGVTQPTIWRWTKETPGFPQPVKLSPGCTRWKLADLEAFEGRATEAPQKQGRGRPRKGVARVL